MREIISNLITLDVPQGGVLRPVLFLLYINDISDNFSDFKSILFTEDIAVYLTGPDPVNLFSVLTMNLKKKKNYATAMGSQ